MRFVRVERGPERENKWRGADIFELTVFDCDFALRQCDATARGDGNKHCTRYLRRRQNTAAAEGRRAVCTYHVPIL